MSYGSYLIILAGAQTRRLCACICSTGGSSNLTFSELNHDDIRERRITQTIWLSGWWFQFGFIAMLIIYNPKGGQEGAFSTYRSRQNLRLMHATLPACLPGPFDTGTFQPPQRPPENIHTRIAKVIWASKLPLAGDLLRNIQDSIMFRNEDMVNICSDFTWTCRSGEERHFPPSYSRYGRRMRIDGVCSWKIVEETGRQ